MSKVYFVPNDGIRVPDPAVVGGSNEAMVPAEGKWVEYSAYWGRRERDGSGRIYDAPPAQSSEGGE